MFPGRPWLVLQQGLRRLQLIGHTLHFTDVSVGKAKGHDALGPLFIPMEQEHTRPLRVEHAASLVRHQPHRLLGVLHAGKGVSDAAEGVQLLQTGDQVGAHP